ncbi:jacalin-like lectin [Haliangium sp.]|uniref:jacalin-like lectin n=1 Tax=Haliangium sp. TaxID=2663208 RepID=UPI003D102F80
MKRLESRALVAALVAAVSLLPGEQPTSADTATTHDWAVRALHIQANIDLEVPLWQTTWVGTHNSFGNPEDDKLKDYNQRDSIKNQLRAGVRELVFDVHYEDSALRLCHNNTNTRFCKNGVTGNRKFQRGLDDIKEWLNDGNSDQVVLLKLSLADSARRNINRVERKVEDHLGRYVFRTTSVSTRGDLDRNTGCTKLNTDIFKRTILNHGKNVLIVTSEGCISDGGFNELVFYAGDTMAQPSNPSEIPSDNGERRMYRVKDGATRDQELSNTDNLKIKTTTVDGWLDAGLNVFEMYGFDSIKGSVVNAEGYPATDEDKKWLVGVSAIPVGPKHLVWSWRNGQPDDAGDEDCAIVVKHQGVFRFSDMKCPSTYRYVCQSGTGQWKVTADKGPWQDGDAKCGSGWYFRAPTNKVELNALEAVISNPNEGSWINYTDQVHEGEWMVNTSRGELDAHAWSTTTVVGGPEGGWFDDVEQLVLDLYRKRKRYISKVEIAAGNRVDKVRITYSDGREVSHGSNDPKHVLTLRENEYLANAKVCIDTPDKKKKKKGKKKNNKRKSSERVFYLEFTTSQGRVIKGGKQEGDCTSYSESGREIFALRGRSGAEIDAISFYLRRHHDN